MGEHFRGAEAYLFEKGGHRKKSWLEVKAGDPDFVEPLKDAVLGPGEEKELKVTRDGAPVINENTGEQQTITVVHRPIPERREMLVLGDFGCFPSQGALAVLKEAGVEIQPISVRQPAASV